MKNIKAEIFCVGTELLLGDIINTNASYISKKLAELGISVYYHTVTGDNFERLCQNLKLCLSRSDIIIMTGGLGPTYDDITKEAVCCVLNKKMHTDENIKNKIRNYFLRKNVPVSENNFKQSLVPDDSVIFENDFGTAPGLCVECEGKSVILLPGPPNEVVPMFENHVFSYLKKYSDSVLVSKNINIFGIGESAVEEKLYDLMKTSVNPTVAPYVNSGEVRVRITAKSSCEKSAEELIIPVAGTVKRILKDYVYGIDSKGIEYELVLLLTQKKLKISVCETCTGGLISKFITDVPGSSRVFEYGVCTYANQVKEKVLNVSHETLEKYGAVSKQTAEEMAQGLLNATHADIAVSTTGIAGPDGGTPEKPQGLVYIGIALSNGKILSKKFIFGHNNKNELEYIRTLAAKNALKLALDFCKSDF